MYIPAYNRRAYLRSKSPQPTFTLQTHTPRCYLYWNPVEGKLYGLNAVRVSHVSCEQQVYKQLATCLYSLMCTVITL
jgi:hypothetical protein